MLVAALRSYSEPSLNPAAPVATMVILVAAAPTAPAGSAMMLTASVVPNPGGGTVTFREDIASAPLLSTAPLDPATGTAVTAVLLPQGAHRINATFDGSASHSTSTSPAVVVVGLGGGKASTTSLAISDASVEVSEPTTLTAKVAPQGTAGEVVFTDGASVLGTATLESTAQTVSVTFRPSAPGTYRVMAAYLGGGSAAGSASAPVSVEVSPDTTVRATGIGISYSTFYPAKDGYRDTVGIEGMLLESANVNVAVVSVATGKRVRSIAGGEREGAYSIPWNGRSDSGALQPPGKYRIVQTLTDAAGNTLTKAFVVTLSPKQIHYVTETQTMTGIEGDVDGEPGSPLFAGFQRGDHLIIYNTGTPPSGIYTFRIKYHFTLPAGVWKTLKFEVNASSPFGPLGAQVTIQPVEGDWSRSAWTRPGGGWVSFSAGAEGRVSSKNVVTGLVYLDTWPGGQNVEIAQVRLSYKHGVLR